MPVRVASPEPTTPGPAAERALFPHQQEALAKLVAWRGSAERAGVLVLPTGAGKTRVAAELVVEALRHPREGAACLWLAHRDELIDQATEAIAAAAESANLPCSTGRYASGGTLRARFDVVVASIPTLAWRRDGDEHARLDALFAQQGGFDLVIVDEAHHATARTWQRLLKRIRERHPNTHILALTATPTRGTERDTTRLRALFEQIIHELQPIALVQSQHLARPAITLVDTESAFALTEQEVEEADTFGDLPESLLARIATDEARNALAVETYVRDPARWGRTLFFTSRVEQSRFLAGQLSDAGVRAASVDRSTPKKERARILQAFRDGELDCLCNVTLFTEGTDAPGTQSVFLVRPTRSPVLFQQMVGRAMRGPKVGGVADCHVVAFVDHLEGLAERQIAHDYTWEWEEWRRMGFTEFGDPRWLGSPPRAVRRRPPPRRDAAEANIREQVRERLLEEGVDLAVLRSTLRGWWRIARTQEGRSQSWCLPYFDGDEPLWRWVETLEAAVTAPDTSPDAFFTAHPVPNRLVTLSTLTAAAFATRALEAPLDAPPAWFSLDEASESDIAAFQSSMRDWHTDEAYCRQARNRIWSKVRLSVANAWLKARERAVLPPELATELAELERRGHKAFGLRARHELETRFLELLGRHEGEITVKRAVAAAVNARLREIRAHVGATPWNRAPAPRRAIESRLHRTLEWVYAGELPPESISPHVEGASMVFGRVLALRGIRGEEALDVRLGEVGQPYALALTVHDELAHALCVGHLLLATVAPREVAGATVAAVDRGRHACAPLPGITPPACPACARPALFENAHGTICATCGPLEAAG